MSPVNYTFGPPGLNNLACQWFSNLHCKSGVLPVISERMAKHGGGLFSAVSWSIKDPIGAPGPYEPQES